MSVWMWFGVGLGLPLAIYLAAVLFLAALGRRADARAWAGFVPDCAVLFARLTRDSRVPRRQKWLLVALLAYLSMPLDLVPDFVPVAGALDDAAIVALVLRRVLRGSGGTLVREHWPGPERSLQTVLRLAGTAG